MPKNQGNIFELCNLFQPAGDQPAAISSLIEGLEKGMKKQTLLGATGTGKTFTMANVIAQYNKPALIIAHNKTLAAQVDGGAAQIKADQTVFKKMGVKIPVVSVVKDERHQPKDILGDKNLIVRYKKEILLANNEAHRFSINYHKNRRNKNFLK